MSLLRRAPAKVNLYLHVAAPDARGYHPLQSLVMFADIGDQLALLPAESKAYAEKPIPGLTIDGPFSAGLESGEGNLVLKAMRGFEAAAGVSVDRHSLRLTKNLPVASGIGGGSADAGAVLHLLRAAYAPEMSDDAMSAIAAAIGADGVMCLWARTAFTEGYGERLTSVDLPPLAAVLVNPGVACPTGPVFARYDHAGSFAPIDSRAMFTAVLTPQTLIAALQTTRNDLQPPAIDLVPEISAMLEGLSAQPETRLARMSGSGATCFALCDSNAAAQTLAVRLRTVWPAAWVSATRLGG